MRGDDSDQGHGFRTRGRTPTPANEEAAHARALACPNLFTPPSPLPPHPGPGRGVDAACWIQRASGDLCLSKAAADERLGRQFPRAEGPGGGRGRGGAPGSLRGVRGCVWGGVQHPFQ